jgi:ribonuclease HI
MFFDGASSKEGAGAGVVFISPKKSTFRYSFTLKFSCTNNIAEYEALLLGLKVASHHGIKNLHVIGDSELVISQIRGAYASKNKRLKQYRNVVWDLIELFDAFGISWKDRTQNKMADLLANVAIKP